MERRDISGLLEWLREFFHSERPSEWSWRRLCRAFDLWSRHPEVGAVAVPYAEKYLETWPDAIREAQRSWLSDLVWFGVSPLMGLARRLVFSVDDQPGWARVEVVLRGDGLQSITDLCLATREHSREVADILARDLRSKRLKSLDLTASGFSPLDVRLLALSPGFETLETVAFKRQMPPPDVLDFILDGFPGVATLDLEGTVLNQGGLERLVAHPGLARIRDLNVSSTQLKDGAVSLLESPHLGPLEVLGLYDGRFSRDTVEALAGRMGDLALRELSLSSMNWWGDGLDSVLAEADGAEGIESLALGGAELGDVAVVGRSALFSGLTSLQLYSASLGDDDIEALVDAGTLQGLKVAKLGFNNFGPTGVKALMPALGRVEHLGLEGGRLGVAGMKALVAGPAPAGLRWLGIDPVQSAEWWRALGQWSALETLEAIDLQREATIDDACLLAFVEGGMAEHAPRMSLIFKGLTEAGVKALASSPWLSRLEWLTVLGETVDDAAFETLLRSPHATRLREVVAYETRMTGASLGVVAECGHLEGLEAVWLYAEPWVASGDSPLSALLRSPVCRGLRKITCPEGMMGAAAVEALATSEHVGLLSSVSSLDGLDEASRVRILRSPHLHPALRVALTQGLNPSAHG